MAFTLATVLEAARDRHPAFDRRRVPDAVAARYCTDLQCRLVSAGAQIDRTHLRQSAVIAIATDAANAVGTAGAGTSGGLPGSVASNGTVSVVQAPGGSALGYGEDAAETVVVSERGVQSGSTTTLTDSGSPGWTVNQYATGSYHVVFTAGPNAGERRVISANTSGGLTWADALPTSVTTATRYQIVAASAEALATFGVVTAVPPLETRRGWLVKLNAQGVPYLDLDSPLVATTETGAVLPPHQGALEITAYDDVATAPDPDRYAVTIVPWVERLNPRDWPAVAIEGERLYLAGEASDWSDLVSLEVRYTPVPPAFTSRTDVFLLPDSAQDAVTSALAAFMGVRCAGLPEVGLPLAQVQMLQAEASAAERTYLRMISTLSRGTMRVIREGWY